MSLRMEYRPYPVPEQRMLRKGGLSPDDFLKALSKESQDSLKDLSDRLSPRIQDIIRDVFGQKGGDSSGQQGTGQGQQGLRQMDSDQMRQGQPGPGQSGEGQPGQGQSGQGQMGQGQQGQGQSGEGQPGQGQSGQGQLGLGQPGQSGSSGISTGVVQDAGRLIATLLSRVSEALIDSGIPGGPALASDVLRDATRKAVDELEQKGEISKNVADALRALSDSIARKMHMRMGDIAGSVIRNVDITELSDDDFRKIMDMVADADLKPHGASTESGSGVLGGLWAKLLMDPRTRAYIRSRIRELRTAAYYREMQWPKGKRLEPKGTFRKYFRTGMPFPPVYKTVSIRPKTREDVVFFVDVSGSMGPAYPVIYSVMKAMEDLGLNVRMYAGDTNVKYVHDVDKVLSEEVGGGGTLIGEGARTILSELGSTLRDTSFIVYTDLEFLEDDFKVFKDALNQISATGAKVSVWVYDCDAVRSEVDALEALGHHVVCDVRSMGDMLKALNDMRKELIR